MGVGFPFSFFLAGNSPQVCNCGRPEEPAILISTLLLSMRDVCGLNALDFFGVPLRMNRMNSTQFDHAYRPISDVTSWHVILRTERKHVVDRLILWNGQRCSSLNHQASEFLKVLIFLS